MALPANQVTRAPVQPPQLPPGFRFHPTDDELVVHYLRHRALGLPLPSPIPDVRILQHDPADLLPPGWAEPERYLFTCKEAKYEKGRRANRATDAGYWKATGKEKQVGAVFPGCGGRAVLVGMKRSLVYYRGRPPTGTKTDWVVHEYRLAGVGAQPWGRGRAQPDLGWVLCRLFNKKRAAAGPGPRAAGAADASGPEPEEEEEEAVIDVEEEEDEETEDEMEGEEDKAAAAAPAASSSGFIDFFARAEGAAQQQQQQGQQPQQGTRAASPVVSSSCVTDQ